MALLAHKKLRQLVLRLINRIQSREEDIESLRGQLKDSVRRNLANKNKIIELEIRNETQSARIIKLLDELILAKEGLDKVEKELARV